MMVTLGNIGELNKHAYLRKTRKMCASVLKELHIMTFNLRFLSLRLPKKRVNCYLASLACESEIASWGKMFFIECERCQARM